MIGFTLFPELELRLPAGNENTSLVHLVVYIRDTLDCITEYNLTSVTVALDTEGINNLIGNFRLSTTSVNNDPIMQVLASKNRNSIAQTTVALSQGFDRIDTKNRDKAVSSRFF